MYEGNSINLQQFAEQSYLILKQDYLKSLVKPSYLESFHHNIIFFRSAMRSFFERTEQERLLFEAGDYYLRPSGYRAGYWPQGVFKDVYEGKKFFAEYYYSQRYHSDNRNSLLVPENDLNSESLPELEKLPHNQGYDMTQFVERHIIYPLVEELKIYLQPNSHLDFILQIKPIYYREEAILEMHRDKSFFQVVIGPLSDFIIQPDSSNKPESVTLDVGEIFLYTGFQFQEYFKKLGVLDQVKPLTHGVISDEEKRMSIIVGAILKS